MKPLDEYTQQLVDVVHQALDKMKANDLKILDVRSLTSLADVMIIASGTSSRHVKAMADEVVEQSKAHGVRPLGVEGERDAEWVLIDLAGVIIHVMLPATRAFYDLERLWTAGDARAATARPPA